MAEILRITDAADSRLADYTGLTDVALRSRREPAEGLFMAEGELVIRRAVGAGHRLRSVLLEDKWLVSVDDVLAGFEGPAYVADRAVLDAVTGYAVHRGALAAVHRRPLLDLDAALAGAARIIVLEDLVNHTNVGAIFRCAAALGMDAVLVSPRCADPLYRRSVRVSMGAVFAVPWTRLAHWPGDLDTLRAAGFIVAGLTPQASMTVDELARADRDRVALVVGSEGPGLTASTLAACDVTAGIPMSGDVDSLNAAAAVAVACYALTR